MLHAFIRVAGRLIRRFAMLALFFATSDIMLAMLHYCFADAMLPRRYFAATETYVTRRIDETSMLSAALLLRREYAMMPLLRQSARALRSSIVIIDDAMLTWHMFLCCRQALTYYSMR